MQLILVYKDILKNIDTIMITFHKTISDQIVKHNISSHEYAIIKYAQGVDLHSYFISSYVTTMSFQEIFTSSIARVSKLNQGKTLVVESTIISFNLMRY